MEADENTFNIWHSPFDSRLIIYFSIYFFIDGCWNRTLRPYSTALTQCRCAVNLMRVLYTVQDESCGLNLCQTVQYQSWDVNIVFKYTSRKVKSCHPFQNAAKQRKGIAVKVINLSQNMCVKHQVSHSSGGIVASCKKPLKLRWTALMSCMSPTYRTSPLQQVYRWRMIFYVELWILWL